MKVVTGNVWTYQADVICIPTNGFIKGNGKAVMGRGVARQALERIPGLDYLLGLHLKETGNHVIQLQDSLWTFPVKHKWNEYADPMLIRRSAQELADLQDPNLIYVLPRPGCGNGQLKWNRVAPIIEPILPDNIHIIDLK